VQNEAATRITLRPLPGKNKLYMKLAPPGNWIKPKQTRRCESEVLFQCAEHRMCCGLVTDELVPLHSDYDSLEVGG